MNPEKKKLVARLKKVEGQVRGVSKMLQEDRYCIDILQQTQALRAALSRVEDGILKDHAATCIEDAIKSGDQREQRKKFSELVDLMSKVKS